MGCFLWGAGGHAPTYADGEGAVGPVAAFDDGHLAAEVGAGAVEGFVGVAVVGVGGVGVGDAGVVVGRHCWGVWGWLGACFGR